jgi:membrane-bound metal-dependent hydrolase YbcI (DUF457 family)
VDTVTHTLAGLCLAELGFTRRLGTSRARLLAVVGANLADADLALLLVSRDAYLFQHAGATHGLLAAFLAAPVLALLTVRIRRPHEPAPPLGPAWSLATLVLLSHVILDGLSPWGVRALAPWNPAALSLDWLFPVDPALWAILALFSWGRRLRLPAQQAATWAIVAAGFYVGLHGAASGVARNQAAAHARLEGFEGFTVEAFPDLPGGLWWNTLVVNDEEVLHRPVTLPPGPVPAPATRIPRGLEEPLVQEFLATSVGRRWLRFACVPVAASLELEEGGYEVWLRDLRFLNRFLPSAGVVPLDMRARFSPGGLLVNHQWFLGHSPPSLPSPLPPVPGAAPPDPHPLPGVP